MTKHTTVIVPVAFENKISDTRPWDLCGCPEHEPMRLEWVRYFQRQHDDLYRQQAEGQPSKDMDELAEDTHLHIEDDIHRYMNSQ